MRMHLLPGFFCLWAVVQTRRSSDSDAKSEAGDETQFLRAFSGNKESDYCMMSSPRARSSSPDAGSLLGNPSFQVKHFRHNVVCGSHLRSHVLTVHSRCLFCPAKGQCSGFETGSHEMEVVQLPAQT